MFEGLRKVFFQSFSLAQATQHAESSPAAQQPPVQASFLSVALNAVLPFQAVSRSQQPPSQGANISLFSPAFSPPVSNSSRPPSDPAFVELFSKNLKMVKDLAADQGLQLKPDNPFHDLMALELASHSQPKVLLGYRLVTDIRLSLIGHIEEAERVQSTPLTPKQKLQLLHKIIEEEMGFEYEWTGDLLDGLAIGELDCDTQHFLFFAVAHEMGWPIHGVRAPMHFFVRWDDGETLFNMDLEAMSYTDASYMGWFYGVARRIDDGSLEKNVYLKSLTREELISDFLVTISGLDDQTTSLYMNEAIRLDPSNLYALEYLENFRLIIALDPRNVEIHLKAGIADFKLNRPSEAVATFQRVSTLMEEFNLAKPGAFSRMQTPEEYLAKIAGSYLEAIVDKYLRDDYTFRDYIEALAISLSGLPPSTQEKIFLDFYHSQPVTAQRSIQYLYSLLGRRVEAEKHHLMEVLSQNSKDPEVFAALGRIFYFQRHYDLAKESLQNALQKEPSNAHTQYTLGNVHYALGDVEAAKMAYVSALALDPDNPLFLTSLSSVLSDLKHFSLAQRLLESALLKSRVKDADVQSISVGMGKLDLFYGRPQQAKENSEKALALQPKNEVAALTLGWACHDLKDYKKSQEVFGDFLVEHPEDINALLGMGAAHYGLKSYTEARSYFLEALDIDPKNTEAKSRLAWVDFSQGEVDGAQAAFQNILFENYLVRRVSVSDPWMHSLADASALYGLGMVYAEKGKYSRALDYLKKAAPFYPHHLEFKEDLQKIKKLEPGRRTMQHARS